MKVSMVSVSRRAGPPHVGQVAFTKLAWYASGDSPRRLELGILRQPHRQSGPRAPARCRPFGQYTIGIGVPQ